MFFRRKNLNERGLGVLDKGFVDEISMWKFRMPKSTDQKKKKYEGLHMSHFWKSDGETCWDKILR